MIASERRREILSALNRDGIITLRDIAQRLNVAEITVRRDFEKLEAEGKLKRVQGGASLDERESAELTMTQKLPIHMPEKEAIAEYADSLIMDGDCIFIDAGTTGLPLAAKLIKRNVRIITYNTLLLERMKKSSAKLFVIGGEYLPYYNMTVGPFAQESLKQFHFDIAFFGCSGIDVSSKSVFTTEIESLQMKKIALQNADKKILLADNYKLQSKGFLRICDAEVFDQVIINRRISDRYNDSENSNVEYPDNFLFV